MERSAGPPKKFDQVPSSRWLARIQFAGTVAGVNEDGPNRQQLDGYCYFDLESQHVSYVFLKGVHLLLDKEGWICDAATIHTATDGLIRPGATRREPWRFGNRKDEHARGYSDHFPVTVKLRVQ